jgi:hypothetical protein
VKAFFAILLILVQVAASFGVATCAPAAGKPAGKSCCCQGNCACAPGSCCVGQPDRPSQPAPAAPARPSVENDSAWLLPAAELSLRTPPDTSLLLPPASLAASPAAAVPVFCRDCAFLL